MAHGRSCFSKGAPRHYGQLNEHLNEQLKLIIECALVNPGFYAAYFLGT